MERPAPWQKIQRNCHNQNQPTFYCKTIPVCVSGNRNCAPCFIYKKKKFELALTADVSGSTGNHQARGLPDLHTTCAVHGLPPVGGPNAGHGLACTAPQAAKPCRLVATTPRLYLGAAPRRAAVRASSSCRAHTRQRADGTAVETHCGPRLDTQQPSRLHSLRPTPTSESLPTNPPRSFLLKVLQL